MRLDDALADGEAKPVALAEAAVLIGQLSELGEEPLGAAGLEATATVPDPDGDVTGVLLDGDVDG